MKIVHDTFDYKIEKLGFMNFELSEALFFDIETTGFSAAHTKLYLIGCIYYDNDSSTFKTKQWFLDDTSDEREMLLSFFNFAKNFKKLIHFNGDGFDLPYINHKCDYFIIDNVIKNMESIDFYKVATSLKKIFKLENMKQKTIEKFLDIKRDDLYSGGELIKVYEDYLKYGDDKLFNLLMLHNLDDLKGLLQISVLLNYKEFFNGHFNIHSIAIQDIPSNEYSSYSKEVIIELKLKCDLPSRISAAFENYYLSAWHDTARLRCPIYTNELKFFYPNYKDYYYLPQEDRSIHKSIAFCVDKNFRTQAKAANCYSKKTGRFLPQYEEIISPYFKIEFFDRITYFELTDEFLKDANLIKAFASHMLAVLTDKP